MKRWLCTTKDMVEQMEKSAKENKVFVWDSHYITYEWTIEEYIEKGNTLADYLESYHYLKSHIKED